MNIINLEMSLRYFDLNTTLQQHVQYKRSKI